MNGAGSTASLRVGFLLASDFEDAELRVPHDRLRAAGYRVEVIGAAKGATLHGRRGAKTAVDRFIGNARPGEFDAIVIPGGGSPDALRADPRFVDFVRSFDALRRPLAAVGHGPQLLLSAGLVRGRTLTAWPTVQRDLRFAGADTKDEPLVVFDHWITSRRPEDLPHFTDALFQALEDRARARVTPAPETARLEEPLP